jgi:hypothetical protein
MRSVQSSVVVHSRRALRRVLLALVLLAGVAPAAAQVLPAYPTGASPSASAWFPDRYPPAHFENAGALHGRDDVLRLGLAAADGQSARLPVYNSTFYNTQGRKLQIGGGGAPASWIGSLYLPASWSAPSPSDGSLTRRSDLWATLWPASGGDTCAGAGCDVFPIVGFSNAAVPDRDNNPGGTPRFRVFDGANGGWINLATPVTFDAWADICVTFTGSAVEYRINGALVYTASDLAQVDTGYGPVTQLGDVSVQAYNYGYTYEANWSRLAAGSGSCADLAALFEPPTATPTTTPTASDTPTVAPTDTFAPTATDTPTVAPTDTFAPTATDTPTVAPTDTATASPTASSSATPPATATPSTPPTPTATALCPPAPRSDCRSAGKAALTLRKGASPARDQLRWKWNRGAAMALADLVDPMQGAGYALCVYAGATPTLIAANALPAGTVWSAPHGKGYRYRDGDGGIERALIRANARGRARAFARGSGADLADPPLGDLPLPVTAQLLSPQGGTCLATVFDAAAVRRNDATRFKARVR